MRNLLFVLLLSALAACSGSELVGLHVALQPDGSAAITARVLAESPTPSPAEVTGKGALWGKRAALVYTQGAVQKLQDLRFGDDSLTIRPFLDANKLTVRLERGATVGWVTAFVPDKVTRQSLAQVYDPLGKTKELGDAVRLEFVLPSTVNSSSVLPTARGVEAGREGKRAWLSIPVDTAREKGEALSWDITW
ncbi:MAG: hypothetical protein JNK15_12155 [Planctomycetes bacterium]|nr:hypothetical protein [Planctomycetota bacterium]